MQTTTLLSNLLKLIRKRKHPIYDVFGKVKNIGFGRWSNAEEKPDSNVRIFLYIEHSRTDSKNGQVTPISSL